MFGTYTTALTRCLPAGAAACLRVMLFNVQSVCSVHAASACYAYAANTQATTGVGLAVQVADQAVPQAEKAAKVINEKADQVADNIEPMADKASKTLVENAEQISREGPEAADKAQAKVHMQFLYAVLSLACIILPLLACMLPCLIES